MHWDIAARNRPNKGSPEPLEVLLQLILWNS